MPSPTAALSTLRPDLGASMEEFDLAMDRQGFIAAEVLPVFETMTQSGPFGKIPLEALLANRETARAPGAGYSRSDWKFETDSFACEEHGAEEPVDDREAKMYANYFDAEVVAAARARDVVLRNAEKRAAALIFNTTTWTGSSLTTAVGTAWSTVATAVPITDVNAARQKVWDGCGMWPNALIITRKVCNNIRNCTSVKDAIAASGAGFATTQRRVTLSMLAEVFDLDKIIVAGSAKNTAAEGQNATIASIWSDSYAMVCRVAVTDDIREPCLGRTFHWGEDGSQIGGLMESYREEQKRSDIIRCRHDVDEKVLYTQMGHLLSNIT
jgi:hypothetical protein